MAKYEIDFECSVCRKAVHFEREGDAGAAGYATDDQDRKVCYECCAVQDRAWMQEHGKIALYLTYDSKRATPFTLRAADWKIANWCGTLKFSVLDVSVGRHNIARVRRDAHFIGPDGMIWHAVQYGGWTDIAHCKRTQRRA